MAASVRETAALLKDVPLFAGCSKRELETIAGAMKEVNHSAGHVIAREGDIGLGFFLITEGTASVTVGGKARVKLGPRDSFGEISLLDHGPRTATVTAATPIRLLGLTAWAFKGVVQQHPALALNLLKVLAKRLRSVSKDATS